MKLALLKSQKNVFVSRYYKCVSSMEKMHLYPSVLSLTKSCTPIVAYLEILQNPYTRVFFLLKLIQTSLYVFSPIIIALPYKIQNATFQIFCTSTLSILYELFLFRWMCRKLFEWLLCPRICNQTPYEPRNQQYKTCQSIAQLLQGCCSYHWHLKFY